MQDFLTNCANVLQKYGFSYLRGAGTTMLLALVGTFFGCLIGFAVGALQTIPIDKQRDPAWKRVLLRILRVVLRCYVELFRGTPMIVQAVFIYYGLLQGSACAAQIRKAVFLQHIGAVCQKVLHGDSPLFFMHRRGRTAETPAVEKSGRGMDGGDY